MYIYIIYIYKYLKIHWKVTKIVTNFNSLKGTNEKSLKSLTIWLNGINRWKKCAKNSGSEVMIWKIAFLSENACGCGTLKWTCWKHLLNCRNVSHNVKLTLLEIHWSQYCNRSQNQLIKQQHPHLLMLLLLKIIFRSNYYNKMIKS